MSSSSDETSSSSTSSSTTESSTSSSSEDTASEMDYGDWGTNKSRGTASRRGSTRRGSSTIRGMEQQTRKGVSRTVKFAGTVGTVLCIGFTLLCCFLVIVIAIVVFVLAAAGLATYFLVPREPSLSVAPVTTASQVSYRYANDTGQPLEFSYVADRTMKNDNYYDIDVTKGVWRAFVTSLGANDQFNNDFDLEGGLTNGESYPITISSNGEEQRSYVVTITVTVFRQSITPFLADTCFRNGTATNGSFVLEPMIVEDIEYSLWGSSVTIEDKGEEFTVQCES